MARIQWCLRDSAYNISRSNLDYRCTPCSEIGLRHFSSLHLSRLPLLLYSSRHWFLQKIFKIPAYLTSPRRIPVAINVTFSGIFSNRGSASREAALKQLWRERNKIEQIRLNIKCKLTSTRGKESRIEKEIRFLRCFPDYRKAAAIRRSMKQDSIDWSIIANLRSFVQLKQPSNQLRSRRRNIPITNDRNKS